MAKGSGGTRAGSSRNPSGVGGGYTRGGTYSDADTLDRQVRQMRNSLQTFARSHNFAQGFAGSITRQYDSDMGRDNVKSASIDVYQQPNGGGSYTLGYETRITGSRAAQYGSRDFEAYQDAIFRNNAQRYNTLEDAYKGLQERVRRLNGMVIRQ